MSKQCPNCGSYKTMGTLSLSGIVTLVGGSCLGVILMIFIAPLLPFILGMGALLIIYDVALIAMKKKRPYYCQKCHYHWSE